jgi:hypothetical protein
MLIDLQQQQQGHQQQHSNNSWEPKNANGSITLPTAGHQQNRGNSRQRTSAGMLATADIFAIVETLTTADRKQLSQLEELKFRLSSKLN